MSPAEVHREEFRKACAKVAATAESVGRGVRLSTLEAGVTGFWDPVIRCGGFSMTRLSVWVRSCAERSEAPTVLESGKTASPGVTPERKAR